MNNLHTWHVHVHLDHGSRLRSCAWCKNQLLQLDASTRPIWVDAYTCEEWYETPKTSIPICTQVDFDFCFEVLILILYFRIYYYYHMVDSQQISDQLYTSVSKIVTKHGSTVDVSVIINAFDNFTKKVNDVNSLLQRRVDSW